MAPPPPMMLPPSRPPPGFVQGADLRSVSGPAAASSGTGAAAATAPPGAFVRGDDLSSVPALPPGWRAIPSKSRPGEVSYFHEPTGLKQARLPTATPSAEAVERFLAVTRAAKAKKKRKAAPLLRNKPTANWQTYLKKTKS